MTARRPGRRGCRCRRPDAGLAALLALAAMVALGGCKDAIDPTKLVPDGSLRSRCSELPARSCVRATTQVCDNVAGAYSLVVPAAALHQRISVSQPRSGEAAVAVDWADGKSDVAGLVVSRPAERPDAAGEALAIIEALRKAEEFTGVRVVDAGRSAVTHDGHSLRIGVEVELVVASVTALGRVRDALYPLLLGGSLARYGELPRREQESGDRFRLRFAVIVRAGPRIALVSGALASANAWGSPRSLKRARANVLASGTSIGALGQRPAPVCETQRFNDLGQLDLIWVIDESDRMAKAREMLLRVGGQVWRRAALAGLDFRMAVVGIGQTSADGLCRPDATSQRAFFGPGTADLRPLQNCLHLPSGRERPSDIGRGVARMKNTLTALTPATVDGVARLRSGAVSAFIIAADRAPTGVVENVFGGAMPDMLDDIQRSLVGAYLAPLTQAMRQSGTLAHAIVSEPGGTPRANGPSCGDQRSTGYIELTARGDGVVTSICRDEPTLVAALTRAVDDLAARASPLALRPSTRAVVGTLHVQLNDRLVEESPTVGDVERRVLYDPVHNRLVLLGVVPELLAQKNVVEIAYLGW